jgi:hypothetical protein
MNISTTLQVSNANDIHNSDLNSLDDLGCALSDEDPKGHHTFQASPSMTKTILSMLTSL